MDPPEPSTGGGEGGRGGEGEERGGRAGPRSSRLFFFRGCFRLVFSLATLFLLSFLAGLLGLAIEQFTTSVPVSVPSTCRIVSSGVDIRASKICALGMLNFKAKQVFYASEKTRFRCRYDYYWASVFEVEYREQFSRQIFHAMAEVPKEALPEECRPGFRAAWLTRMKFKVNETYRCWYIPGSNKADILSDDLFNCQAKEPSMTEMIRRYYILMNKLYFYRRRVGKCKRRQRWFRRSFSKDNSIRHILYPAAGVISGMLLSMFLIILIRSLHLLARASAKKLTDRSVNFVVQLRRICLLMAYLSAMGWFTLQYSKIIGLKQLLFN